MPLMSGVRVRVGVVFVMHVHQLQVRAAVPIPFVALFSTAPSARVPQFGNCWGWRVAALVGWTGGSLRQQTPSPCYLD